MRRVSFEDRACSVARCLEVVGDWWTMLIVRDLTFGVTRFDDIQRRLGVARNVLTQRLEHLVRHEVVERVPYQDHPARYDYRLTEKGRDLWQVLTAMRQWGDRWAATGGPPVEMVHLDCGHVATAVPHCSECGAELRVSNMRAVPGPGGVDPAMVPPARDS
ncbi:MULTISPECIES: helix-turn-helix domain-containing protein [Protofrankia]|uniref:HxlR family transcriptional regulator n=1 Tax=Protofrankia coriariae TaxID=1562887 RepID=A0ABR5EZ80_9ACTN|nr:MULTISPECIES: helix-turn-helix domain-containing protein [Protofrankia]KLL09767.1 HxlR family transcriptional regulator [Protofrankia coriariae]ONH31782.1 transcriptional regulator [Protofrankia sp. BMG5.30]